MERTFRWAGYRDSTGAPGSISVRPCHTSLTRAYPGLMPLPMAMAMAMAMTGIGIGGVICSFLIWLLF